MADGEFLRLLFETETDLRAFLRSALRESAAADDVFQETALVLWQRFAEYDRSRPFGAWARGIALKKLLQRRERDQRAPRALSPEALQAVAEAFDRLDGTSTTLREDALTDCLSRLPAKSRELIELRYREDNSPEEIATRTGRTVAAVYQALSRVRSLLEECIQTRLSAAGGRG